MTNNATPQLGTHTVKVKLPNHRRWEFLDSDGSLTHLRVHAATMTKERAHAVARQVIEQAQGTDIEGVETKVVPF
jgi:hypothetical protein